MMNGISLVISKPCCPVYNFGTINKIKFGTSNKIDLIPCRLSNLLHQRTSSPVATKPMMKHRVYSSNASKDVTGSTSEAPEASCTAVPCALVAGLLGIIGLSLLKASQVVVQFILTRGGIEGVLKSNACYNILLGVAAYFVAKGLLGNIMSGFAVLRNKPFSFADIIEVGQLKGQVIEMGLTTTSLTEETRLKVVPNFWLYGKDFVNKSRTPSRAMDYEISMSIAEIEKLPEISEEIKNMMRSNSIIYLEQEQPFCYLSGFDSLSVTLSYGCKLKLTCEQEFRCAEDDILMKSLGIIKKHGATLVDPIKK